jgi:membrane fusion protein, multidrug efflux system
MALTGLRFLAVLAALALLAGCRGKTASPPRRAESVPVSVVQVARKAVPLEIRAIGNAEAISTISVKSQVGGELTRVHFTEGDYVRKGQTLFTIDQRPLQAQVAQVEANLARDKAQLSQAQANLARDEAQAKYAEAQFGRMTRLAGEGVISRENLDQARAEADARTAAVRADQAAIESAKAAIQADLAALENARVQLGYTTINSPIDGRTGNLSAKQGNLIKANDIELLTINQVTPIYVAFAVPEAQLGEIKRYMAQRKLEVTAAPQDDTAARETGVLTFVDNAVDRTTGTIRLKGTFANAARRLWPGQFVQVTLRLTTQADALVVPSEAIQTGQQGQYVFVVKADMTVESRAVEPGIRTEREVVIDRGLQAGETVVTEGQLRLAPGVRVQFKPAAAA